MVDIEIKHQIFKSVITQSGSQFVADACILATCLLYTSDAADERSSVDLGGRRIIKKKKIITNGERANYHTKQPINNIKSNQTTEKK